MTISLDLMELDDFRQPKQLVAEICRQNPGMTIPVPLEELAEAAGIREVFYRQLDGMAGAMVANLEKTEGCISIKDDDPPLRQRFTFGHELGHFLIAHHGNELYCSPEDMRRLDKAGLSNAQAQIEIEANTFSSELLMPKRQFCQRAEFRADPSLESIANLKDAFGVSFQACAHRYVNLSDYPVAMVFSLNGRVNYSTRSDDFPFWVQPKRGEVLPAGTLSQRAANCLSDTFSNDSTDAESWISEARGFEMPEELIEFTLVQNDGYMVTLLWCEEDIAEVE